MSRERPWAPPPAQGDPGEHSLLWPALSQRWRRSPPPWGSQLTYSMAPTSGLGPLQVVPFRAVGSNPQGGRGHCPSPLPSPSVWPCQPHPTCPGPSRGGHCSPGPPQHLPPARSPMSGTGTKKPSGFPLASAPAPGHRASLLCHLPAPSGHLIPAQGLSSGPIHRHTHHSASSHCSQH